MDEGHCGLPTEDLIPLFGVVLEARRQPTVAPENPSL
jgi:hypothetical protein